MYNKHKEAICLDSQKERFKRLADVSSDAARCYEDWKRKDLTLEQALSQTVKELTDHCYKLLQPIPANFLVPYGQHIDYVDLVNESSSYPLLEKAELLTKYLICLSNIVAGQTIGGSFLIIEGKVIK